MRETTGNKWKPFWRERRETNGNNFGFCIGQFLPGQGALANESVYTIVAIRLKSDGTADTDDACTMTLTSKGAFTDC